MTVRAIWTGLIRFASMLEVVIERCVRRIEALPENELRSKTCLDCAVLQLPQEEAGTLHLEQLLIAPQFQGSSQALEMVAISGRMRSPTVGQMGEAFIVLKLVIRRCLICENRFSRQAVRLRRSTSVLPPDFRPLPHAGRQRYVWHKWLQN
jgi:hypothetical protein